MLFGQFPAVQGGQRAGQPAQQHRLAVQLAGAVFAAVQQQGQLGQRADAPALLVVELHQLVHPAQGVGVSGGAGLFAGADRLFQLAGGLQQVGGQQQRLPGGSAAADRQVLHPHRRIERVFVS